MQIYLVGGAVRDLSQNKTPNDYDYVLEAPTPEALELLKPHSIGKDFPVYLVEAAMFFELLLGIEANTEIVFSPDFVPDSVHWPIELAVTRRERSTGPSHKDFVADTINVSLKEDQRRRDLTVNSIAMGPEGLIYDPFNGMDDNHHNILREVAPDTFVEDPLRVLRAARFYANNPKAILAQSLVQAMQKASLNLHTISPERVWMELSKVKDWPRFFEILDSTKCLNPAFPKLAHMSRCNEPGEWHLEPSVFIHTMMVLRNLPVNSSKALKVAALYHDILKPEYYTLYGNAYGHENVKELPSFIPASIAKDALILIQNHQTVYVAHTLKPGKLATFINQYTRNEHLLADQIALAEADREGRITKKPAIPLWQSRILPLLLTNVMHISVKDWIDSQAVNPSPKRIGQARVELTIKACSEFKKYIRNYYEHPNSSNNIYN